MKIVLFGAGSTGRGHLTALLYEYGIHDITLIDKKRSLIDTLNQAGGYEVRLLGGNPRTLSVTGLTYLHTSQEAEINAAITEADLVLTAVLAENLPDVAVQVANAIDARRRAGNSAVTNVVCCENLDRATSVLKKEVYTLLSEENRAYADEKIGFADAMISRVVPLAVADPIHMLAEDYNEWVAERSSFLGDDPKLPFFTLTDRLDAYLERKLWIHNGGHATVAYAAVRKGHTYIHQAVADPEIAAFAGSVLDELGDTIIHKHGFSEAEIRAYENNLCVRGEIEEMRDEIARVVRDPLRKLAPSDRLLAPAIYAETHGLSNENILHSIVNATLYKSESDAQSIKMQADIEKNGYEAFLRDTLGLAPYPEMVEKLADIRKKLIS